VKVAATASLMLAACGAAPAPPAPAGTLETIGAMTEPRAAHSATLLATGLVLVAGGLSGSSTTATAELYDPAVRTFRHAGRMTQARADHTATLLSDGRVLIAGGVAGEFLASTEIYDPATGAFAPGPAMSQSRSGAVAIGIGTGRVLIAGGTGGTSQAWITRSGAEIYDPATGAFSRTGDMAVPRESHTATVLPGGGVLITGGHAGRGSEIRIHSSAELYDPRSGLFTTTGSMARIRHKHDAVLLPDGRVLIAGGADQRDDQGTYRDTETYSATSGAFSGGTEMLYARYKHKGTSVALPDGRVLLAGGATRPELYDEALNAFRPVGGSAMLRGSFSAVAALPGGQVLITGGYGNGQGPGPGAWIFSP
jgi:hypothetical protein